MSKQDTKDALERWARTLRHLRDAPEWARPYSQSGDHFSFPVPGDVAKKGLEDAAEAAVIIHGTDGRIARG